MSDLAPPIDSPAALKIQRLRRKLEQRDRRIAGLARRLARLEGALAIRSGDTVVVNATDLRRDLARAVTDALCNVRMIPVHNIGGHHRIAEVRIADTPQPLPGALPGGPSKETP